MLIKKCDQYYITIYLLQGRQRNCWIILYWYWSISQTRIKNFPELGKWQIKSTNRPKI